MLLPRFTQTASTASAAVSSAAAVEAAAVVLKLLSLASSYCSLLTIKSTFRFVTSPSRSFFAKSAPAASPCPGSVEIFQSMLLLLPRELVGSKNREGSRQKLVLQSVFLLRSLRGIISSLGCCSRNSPLTWLKLRLTEEQRRPGKKGDGAGREQF